MLTPKLIVTQEEGRSRWLIVDKPVAVSGQDDAAKAQWFPLSTLPELAFDHDEIMRDAIQKYEEVVK